MNEKETHALVVKTIHMGVYDQRGTNIELNRMNAGFRFKLTFFFSIVKI